MEMFDKYVGQTFGRRYKIVKVIGVGGMAVVFEAFDTVMKQNVAVKMLKDEISNDASSLQRFINESKAVSMLSQANIVQIHDVSVTGNPKFIVMELVDGITLKSYMNKKGALSTKEVLSYTEQILKALNHAHSKGIIHRDIKPQNIMLLKNGRIKVTDFGIAKLPNAETVTMTDKAIGTVFYINPEQASGKPVDPRSDLYSLGVVMYEMATGQLPFMADSPVTVALMQVSDQPRRPREINPSIPIGLEQIILGAMEKNPERRLQSASQMLRHIMQIKANPDYVFHSARTTDPAHHSAQSGQSSTSTRQTGGQTHSTARTTSGGKSTARPSGSSGTGQRPRKKTTQTKTKPNPSRPKARQSQSMLPIISGVIMAFLIVIAVSGISIFNMMFSENNISSPKTITIEDFVGDIYSTALAKELNDTRYFHVKINEVYDENYEPYTIIRQDPLAGEKRKVKAGEQYCDLELTVSKGAKTVNLPDFTIMEHLKVSGLLRQNGLIPKESKEFSATVPMGYVIRTEPAAGTMVTSGDTVVVVVSKGEDITYVSVPDFSELTEQKAVNVLLANELKYGKITYEFSDKVEKGKIIRQSKAHLTEVPEGTAIDFVVSAGPEHPEETDSE